MFKEKEKAVVFTPREFDVISDMEEKLYDGEEYGIFARMKKVLVERHGWEAEDFQGMSFLDVESEFLDAYGEVDFR